MLQRCTCTISAITSQISVTDTIGRYNSFLLCQFPLNTGIMSYNLTGIDLHTFFAINSTIRLSLLVLVALPALSLCLFCVAALLFAHSINLPLRVALASILVGEICYWFAVSVQFAGYPSRAGSDSKTHTCQVATSAFITAFQQKYPAIALYAIMVYIFLKHGVKKLKLKIVVLYVAVSWIVALSIASVSYVPSFGHLNNLGFCDVVSFSQTFTRVTTLIISVTSMSVCMFVIITFSILTYCYYKKNTLTENVPVKRVVARNLAYLMIAAGIYCFFYLSPASFSAIRAALVDRGLIGVVLVEYVVRLIINFGSIVTPIMTIIILQPIRQAMKEILKKTFCRGVKNRVFPEEVELQTTAAVA